MTIAVGDRIPDVEVRVMGDDGPEPIQTGDVLGRGKVVLFALPGAFTPTCSDYHLPVSSFVPASCGPKGSTPSPACRSTTLT